MVEAFLIRLIDLMKKNNISQYRLAKDINAPISTVNSWFRGKAKCPRDNYLNKIAEVLGVHPAWLKYGDRDYAPTLKDEVMRIAEQMQSYTPETIKKIAKIVDTLDDRKQIRRKAS